MSFFDFCYCFAVSCEHYSPLFLRIFLLYIRLCRIDAPYAATMLDSLGDVKRRNLRDMFPNAAEDALDLMSKLLDFSPVTRYVRGDIEVSDASFTNHACVCAQIQHQSNVGASVRRSVSQPRRRYFSFYVRGNYRQQRLTLFVFVL